VTTADSEVDAVIVRLDQLPDLEVADHVTVFTDVHRGLQAVLTELDGA